MARNATIAATQVKAGGGGRSRHGAGAGRQNSAATSTTRPSAFSARADILRAAARARADPVDRRAGRHQQDGDLARAQCRAARPGDGHIRRTPR